MFPKLALLAFVLPHFLRALPDSCLGDADSCPSKEDSSMLQLHRDAKTQKVLTPSSSPEDRFNLEGKSVYLIMTDRFNRFGGYSANDTAACTDLNDWCNGTFAGIREQLPYIKGMGFDCIWVTPVVENPSVDDAPPPAHDEGASGYGYHGYWAQNYYKTDPHFGSNDELKELVKAVHDIGMCFVLDIVMNHMGPIHPWEPLSVEKKIPFDKPEYYHQVDRGDASWDEYTAKYGSWPNPAQSMGPGTLCKLEINSTTGQPDYTNGGNYCNNYANSPPYDNTTYLGEDAPGPPDLKYCGAGNFDCPGYNQTMVWEGWFFDLGDLNHSHPFVVKKQLEWIEWVKTQFDIDAIRLDTAPYVPWTFLAKLQEAAHPVQIHGEVTTTNISFHASFQKYPTSDGGFKVLAGMENFPPFYMATPGYCGDPNQPSSPVAMWDLRKLGHTMTEQIEGPYVTVDGLMNFVDNQDYTPVASTCGSDESRIKNSLTWVFFCYGIPTVTWGTEQGNTVYRNSLWQYGWDTTTWQYQFIKTLNSIRKKADVRFMKTEVVHATADTLTFKRSAPGKEVWVYTNSLSTTARSGKVTYALAPPLPRRSTGAWWNPAKNLPGHKKCYWVDAFTGRRAEITSCGKLVAPNKDPLVLVLSKSKCPSKR
ncbi:unnamed protein product [Polarella glacialis]|uniref:Glycosyl hydrolase family 13 catalytic domain-containing protein n=1 Tax=Polarella glacialis TaxID=89957 RepID=A0A813FUH2_POLGL|nr:unnamed protein product [Polarella glacialis]